jgi:hypothetical protein
MPDDIKAGVKRMLDHSVVGMVKRAGDAGERIIEGAKQVFGGRAATKKPAPTGKRSVTGRR